MQEQTSARGAANGRRGVLVLGAAFAVVFGTNRLLNRPHAPEFEDVPGVPGFRMLRVGGISGAAFDPLIGVDRQRPPMPEIPDSQLCSALFSNLGQGVPVASFSDYYCPYCRVLTRELSARERAGDISVTWHELPLLGETSVLAARAALAADMQGAYPEIHSRLMRSRVVANDEYLATLASGAGLDPERFLRDATSGAVQSRIDTAHGLAARFGFYGTPALVIGRTAVLGAISTKLLDQIISEEATSGQTRGAVCP